MGIFNNRQEGQRGALGSQTWRYGGAIKGGHRYSKCSAINRLNALYSIEPAFASCIFS